MTVRDVLYGSVTDHGATVTVEGSAYELTDWATRPGATWPCSELRHLDYLTVTLDGHNGDLLDLEGDNGADLTADELTAWVDDCLRAAGLDRLARGEVAS